MNQGKTTFWLVWILVLSMLAACGSQGTAAQLTARANSDNTNAGTTTAAQDAGNASAGTGSTTASAAAGSKDAVEVIHATWDSFAVIEISLNDDAITVTGAGASVDGRKVTITSAGTYSLSGTLSDGQVIVDTEAEEPVVLILNGVTIHSATSAPIYIADAKEAVIILAPGTTNTVSDSDAYTLEEGSDEPNAAIFSKADLTIEGSGSLTVTGNYNDGIASKDGLVVASGTLIVNAADDGIRGKDHPIVQGGTITVTAGGDGLKSDNAEDTTRGYILIESGVINVVAGGDAITAQTDVLITSGELTLTTGGGSRGRIAADVSAKGIKGLTRVVIDGGTFTIDSADDAIHSNKDIIIHGGTFAIATGDDAIHADASIEINDGDFAVTTCYEGIESAAITINGGDFHIAASDDALNVAGGNDGSGMMAGPGRGGRPGMGGAPGAMRGQDAFATSGSYYLHINGGHIVVDAAGDGIDINGSVVMTGGVLIINGPTQNMNGALDYDRSFQITGGYLLAVGSAGMAQAPDTSSTQYTVLLNLSSAVRAGTLVHLQDSQGGAILTFAPAKDYQSIVFSSPALAKGTYDVYFGGSATSTATDGLYQGGAYTGGSKAGSFTISSIVTQVGSGGRMR